MRVRFWGVRGSSPAPLGPEVIRGKIAAALQRVKPHDLVNSETRQRFLNSLPPGIFGTTGGNTPCVEVRSAQGCVVVFDAGTGLREMEKWIRRTRQKITEYHIFISHFHYDHILGIPYFGALYDPNVKVTFYSPYPAMERILRKFMEVPYHPVDWDSFNARTEFRILKRNEELLLGGMKIYWIRRNHPNGCISYKCVEAGRSFIYSTDTELTPRDFERTPKNVKYFQDADVIVLDAQYTLGEAIEKYNWGHSSYSLAVEFVREFSIRKLYMFHHDPLNDDAHLEGILRSARWFDSRLEHHSSGPLDIELAREGHEFEL
ncbi:MAG: MBL fold metallo-hydrolase [Spirochaetales bacterium]|nr:MAG: MBL fold metallo-hydrolase [Spirochaetales bacterium]